MNLLSMSYREVSPLFTGRVERMPCECAITEHDIGWLIKLEIVRKKRNNFQTGDNVLKWRGSSHFPPNQRHKLKESMKQKQPKPNRIGGREPMTV